MPPAAQPLPVARKHHAHITPAQLTCRPVPSVVPVAQCDVAPERGRRVVQVLTVQLTLDVCLLKKPGPVWSTECRSEISNIRRGHRHKVRPDKRRKPVCGTTSEIRSTRARPGPFDAAANIEIIVRSKTRIHSPIWLRRVSVARGSRGNPAGRRHRRSSWRWRGRYVSSCESRRRYQGLHHARSASRGHYVVQRGDTHSRDLQQPRLASKAPCWGASQPQF
jgi:hypothetical protein